MAKNILSGDDAVDPADPKTPPTFADLAAMSAAKDGADVPHDPVTGEVVESAVEKPRTSEQLITDVFNALASRHDPIDLDAIRELVNEPGVDGKKRPKVMSGPIQAVLNALCDGKKVHLTKPGKVNLYELTSQTRSEIESPAIIQAVRGAIVLLIAKKLAYADIGHGVPPRVAAVTAASITRGLITGSARGAEADEARTKGEAPTLSEDAAYAARLGLSGDPEEDDGEMIDRVNDHVDRLVGAGMVEALPPVASSGKPRFDLTPAGEALLFASGVGAVVDATFPPKPARPTLEELTQQAREDAQSELKAAIDSAALMQRHFEQEHARAEAAVTKSDGYKKWFIAHSVEDPEQILIQQANQPKGRKIESYDREVELTTYELHRLIDEEARLNAYRKQIAEEHGAVVTTQKATEKKLKTQHEALQEIIRQKEGRYFITVQVYREATSDGKILVYSAEPYNPGALLEVEDMASGTQLGIPGTGRTVEVRAPVKSAVDAAADALKNGSADPEIQSAVDKLKDTLSASGASMTITTDSASVTIGDAVIAKPEITKWDGPVLLTAAGLRAPFETFMQVNKGGVYASVIEDRFFEFLGSGKPNLEVSKTFTKLVAGALSANAIAQGEGGKLGVIYWHTSNDDPRKTDADKGGKKADGKANKKPKSDKGASGKG